MKKLFAIGLLILMISTAGFAAEKPGAAGALAQESFTIEEMLHYAIQDEWLAEAEYNALMDEFGIQRPFSTIQKAEMSHIELSLPLFERYGIDLPEKPNLTILPQTLEEAYEIGIEAEIANISMYEKFLSDESLPTDIAFTFTRLMNGSKNHLAAFQRQTKGLNADMNRGPLFTSRQKNNGRRTRRTFDFELDSEDNYGYRNGKRNRCGRW